MLCFLEQFVIILPITALLLLAEVNVYKKKIFFRIHALVVTNFVTKKWIFTECRKLYRIDLLACKVNPKLVML